MAHLTQVEQSIPFPREEYEDRWRRVYEAIEERGEFSTLVVWQRSGGSYDRAGDVLWLSNYASQASGQEMYYEGFDMGRAHAALIFHEGKDPELHIAEPLSVTDQELIVAGEIHAHRFLPEEVGKRLVELGVEGPVGFAGDDTIPALYHRHLVAAAKGLEFVAVDPLILSLQRVKSDREVEIFRRGGTIASQALSATMEALIAGEAESVAAARGATKVIEAGGGFQRIAINHGSKSENVQWRDGLYGYDTTAPQPGEMVRAWVYGPILHGYWLDPGRSAVCGNEPTDQQRQLLETAVAVTQGLIAACTTDVSPREAGKLGDKLIADSGLNKEHAGGEMWQLYGHSVGSYFMLPMIPAQYPDDMVAPVDIDSKFKPNEVMTVEFFLNEPGVGTATFEELFLITETGPEMLTDTPLLFW